MYKQNWIKPGDVVTCSTLCVVTLQQVSIILMKNKKILYRNHLIDGPLLSNNETSNKAFRNIRWNNH